MPLLEAIRVPSDLGITPVVYPEVFKSSIGIDVIHDGNWIPEEFLRDKNEQPITFEQIDADYTRERDWGACFVAERVAAALGIESFLRVNIARVLMDFGRFPGSTPKHLDHLHRFAINYPFSKRLSYRQKKHLLEQYYDRVSGEMEKLLENKIIKIAIHTYDRLNESGTVRPPVSIITRSIGYQNESEMPAGLFDPLYPDILGEFTADRVLRDRISLTLEKANIPVAHNYPYCFPEGSLEVRYQVWSFFRFVKDMFQADRPETVNNPSYEMVWEMLMDTNLRSSESEALRSYLHMFRTAPNGRREEFLDAERAYEAIQVFVERNDGAIVQAYRFSPSRPSSLGIEIRKDVVYELDPDGKPIRPRTQMIDHIAAVIAEAIGVYLSEDRSLSTHPTELLERVDPWYFAPRT
ncbi:MAG: N-formylglutamate amidohydrolase [Myxococcales bacterium]|nr:N-formylglutamate amidohydrolase [Myxococcales bacterium]